MQSLARCSKRMTWRALCTAMSYYHYLISDSISPPSSGVFSTFIYITFRYQSWWVFSFRSLSLLSSNRDITQFYSGNMSYLLIFATWLSHPMAEFSNSFALIILRQYWHIPKPYNQLIFRITVQFKLVRFQSPLLTESFFNFFSCA